MSESIFSRAYSYRERREKGNLENFLIEVFAGSLELDEKFKNSFLDLLNLNEKENFSISTQTVYSDLGRPDIEISIGDKVVILIECKVDSKQGENQLSRYDQILKGKAAETKKLVYLTKYHESIKSIKDINIQHFTWFDIHELINEQCNILTIELKNFLKEFNIAMKTNFSNLDIVALETIGDTISKMDQVLNNVEEDFSKLFGKPSKSSSRSTRLGSKSYIQYKHFDSANIMLEYGFMWYDWGAVMIGFEIYIKKPFNDNSKIVYDKLKDSLKNNSNWEIEEEEYDKYNSIGQYLELNAILNDSSSHVVDMAKYLKDWMNEIKVIVDDKLILFESNE